MVYRETTLKDRYKCKNIDEKGKDRLKQEERGFSDREDNITT
jgi:hypothetical protein